GKEGAGLNPPLHTATSIRRRQFLLVLTHQAFVDRGVHRVLDALEPDELDVLARLLGDVLEVLAVARGQHDRRQAGPDRGDHLLFDAADRQHQATQADLARHRYVAVHGLARQQRGECGKHRDTGARPILRYGTRRHVDGDVALGEDIRIDAQIARPRLRQAHGDLRTLLHHVAELARQHHATVAGHTRRLDEQDVAADRRPRQPGRNTRHAGAQRHLALEPGRPQDARDVVGVDADLVRLALRDLHGDVAEDRADLALEIAHACSAARPFASSWRLTR